MEGLPPVICPSSSSSSPGCTQSKFKRVQEFPVLCLWDALAVPRLCCFPASQLPSLVVFACWAGVSTTWLGRKVVKPSCKRYSTRGFRRLSSSPASSIRLRTRLRLGPHGNPDVVAEPEEQSATSAMQAQLKTMQKELSQMRSDLAGLQQQLRRVPLHFSVGQYNILAGYLGNNTEPWFLYGVDMPAERRDAISKQHKLQDSEGKYVHDGWPSYVHGLLSEDEILKVEQVHAEHFSWERRKGRLVEVIQDLDVDLLSLVECDHYEDYFQPVLTAMGYDSIWQQRPRSTSHDGCCIAWRRSCFELLASDVVEYADYYDSGLKLNMKDRIALLSLMRSRLTQDVICFVSTHLARNPEHVSKDSLRGRQIGQVIRGISDFVHKHHAEDVPCVLTGDLNATQFERLLGIASVAALLRRDASVHPFVFDCEDMPSRATSVTTARQMRLDAILHQGKYMDLVEACDVPVLSTEDPIPNKKHPSDHVPIKATFRLRSKLEITQQSAWEWYLRLAGRGSFHALTAQELRDAFTLYDHSGSGCITARRVKEAISSVVGTGVADPEEIERVISKLPPSGMDLPTFIDAFKKATLQMGVPGMEDIEATFKFFDKNDNGVLELDEMQAMFHECSPVAVPDDEIEKLFHQINTHCDGQISMEEYKKHIAKVWVSRFTS